MSKLLAVLPFASCIKGSTTASVCVFTVVVVPLTVKSPVTVKLLENVRSMTNIFNCLMSYCIDNNSVNLLDDKGELIKITNKVNKFYEKLLHIENHVDLSNKLDIFNEFLKYTTIKNINYDKLIALSDLFIKRLCSKEINKKKLEAKLYNATFDSLIQNNSNIKIINWIFN